MKALLHKLMYSCETATMLIEKKNIDGLSMTDNLRLSMHTAICAACREYEKHSRLLNSAISNYLNEPLPKYPQKNATLESKARQRIQSEIENSLKKL